MVYFHTPDLNHYLCQAFSPNNEGKCEPSGWELVPGVVYKNTQMTVVK